MAPSRREILAAGLMAAASPITAFARQSRGSNPLGLVIHSFPVRAAGDRERRPEERLADPIRFLDHARSLGARGIQVGIGARVPAYVDSLRAKAEAASMDIEGIVSLPRGEADLGRFEAEIQTAKRAGAAIVRTAMLSGRRYETFDSLAAFREFADRSANSLSLAAPVVVRHGIRLAVENHKDFRTDEQLALIKKIGSDHVGICVDTGNNLALLEDPTETVEALAPLAITTHIKDMGVEEYDRGYRIAEVPLGEGVLDIPRMVRTLRKSHPEIPLYLEMITRDPLNIPCLDDRYWATFPELPAKHLARALSYVRAHPPKQPLPRLSPLEPEERLRVEDENIRKCLAYAASHLLP
jgi:sugar phosphate isomerase/epimerase